MKKIYTLIILLSSILFFGCYTWFQNEIKMDSKTPQTSLHNFLYEEPKITILDSPSEIYASKGEFSRSIKLTFRKVAQARSYRIERAIITPDDEGTYKEPEDSDYVYLDKIIENPSLKEVHYEDIIIKNLEDEENLSNKVQYKNLYFYRVSAENILKGYDSSEFTKTDNDSKGWLLTAPKNVSASKGKSLDSIDISWDKVPNASFYEIYKNQYDKANGRSLLKTVSANTTHYSDKLAEEERGKDYFYEVVAVMKTGAKSSYSERVLGFSLKEGATSFPQNIKIKNGKAQSTNGFTIEWDKSDPADSTHTNITYSIYRSSSVSSVQKLVKSNLTATTYIDSSDLEPGVFYYYFIQTIATNPSDSKDFVKSPFSEITDDSTAYLLSAPTYIEIEDSLSPNQIKLRWKPAIGENQESPYTYQIYTSNEQDSGFVLKDSVQLTFTHDDGYYAYEIEKAPFIKIQTVNNCVPSELSKTVAPNPNAPENVVASKTSSLDGISKYTPNSNNVYPVKITWQKPKDDAPYGYNVYRSTKPDSSFRKINDSVITNDYYFIDQNETARASSIYYYKVVSVNALGQGKNGNDPTDKKTDCIGYGAITPDQWFREYNKTIIRSLAKLTLMHKPNDMDKLGSETKYGDISGSLSYNAKIAGLGAEITMEYKNYCDFYINDDKTLGPLFLINGNTDTTSNMSANGNMHGHPICTGMYPGDVEYGNLQIKSGAAGGGTYGVQTKDLNGNIIFNKTEVDWKVGEEGR